MKNLRRTARRHQAVNSEIWYEFPPGLRVMTPEGFEGKVSAVEDGPFAGSEQYIVDLDGGMGGGEYDSVELKAKCSGCGEWFSPDTQDSDITDSGVEGDHAAREHWNAEIDAFHEQAVTAMDRVARRKSARRCATLVKRADEDQCPYDASDSLMQDGLYRCEAGHVWSPDDPAALRYHGDGPERGQIQPLTSMVRHATSDETRDWGWAGREDMDGEGFIEPPYAEDVQASLRVASEDYPELAEILVERPPLPHSTRSASLRTEAASDEWKTIPGLEIRAKGIMVTATSPEADAHGVVAGKISWYPKTGEIWMVTVWEPYRRMGLASELLRLAKEIRPDLHHSETLTGDGEAWSQAVGSIQTQAAQGPCPLCGDVMLSQVAGMTCMMCGSIIPQVSFDEMGLPYSFIDGVKVSLKQSESGLWDRVLEPVADRMLERQQESGYGTYNPETGAMASYDWCRFRHNRHCFYPKQLDEAATKQAGYAVWVPEDRGLCPREKWDAQKACPAPSEPGPNSGDPNWRYETWKSWADGGQGRHAHLGMPAFPHTARDIEQSIKDIPKPPPVTDFEEEAYRHELHEMVDERQRDKNPYTVAAMLAEGEFGFHMTASWRDVQAKAKKIRAEGHVRIISASVEYLVGQVQGETNVYQTSLMREPGTKKVALWECGCAWAAYSWGRSGRWKKFEGRLCSHALALNYEAQSRGWAGGSITEDAAPPGWMTNKPVVVPGDYQRGPIGDWRKAVRLPAHTAGLTFTAMPAGTFSSIPEVSAWLYAQARQAEPAITNMLRNEASEHFGEMQGLNFRFKEPDSIARKLQTKGVDPASSFDPFAKVKDALRYTIALPEPDWANNVQDILWEIQGAGYRITEEENTWARGDSYSGLHYNFQTPLGLVFEVQFHTASSYDLKDKVLHKMYEEFRNPMTPLQRRQHLWDEMTKYWDSIPIPDNALAFPGEKHYLRPVAHTEREVSYDVRPGARPINAVAMDLFDDGYGPEEVTAFFRAAGIDVTVGRVPVSHEAMSAQPFRALVNGFVTEVLDLFDDGTVETPQGRIPARAVTYPTYHPSRGLTAAKQAMEVVETPEGTAVIYEPGDVMYDEDGSPIVIGIPGVDTNGTPPSYVAKQAGADLDGCMIAIDVPDDVKDALYALCKSRYGDDVEPKDNYHVTVLYPGKQEDVDQIEFSDAARMWAQRWSPMTGRISGFGVFHQEGGDKVLYASVNIPGLDRARNDLVDILSAKGIVVPDDYGFTPHLTLGYFGEANTPQPPEQMEDEVLTQEFPIDSIVVARGTDWEPVSLTTEPLTAAAGIVEDAMTLLEFGNDMGLVEPDAVRWYSRSDAGQASAQADMVGWGGQVADQFNEENPPLGDGCEVCGDSGHSTEQHIADPVRYDDGTRTGSVFTSEDDPEFKVCSEGHVGSTLMCDHPVVSDGMTYAEAKARSKEMAGHDDPAPQAPAFDGARPADSALEIMRWQDRHGPESELKDEPEPALPEVTAEDDEDTAAIIAAFQQTAAGRALSGGGARGGDAGDVALAAKQALKSFSPAEQKQIIDEGEGVTAANLADLDLRGTHYESLEAAFVEAEANDDWMLG